MTREEATTQSLLCHIEALEETIKALEQEPCRDMEEIKEVMNCNADAETKCKMVFNILTAKPHYYKEQEQKYCDRNICISNEYNGIGCDECEVTKSQEKDLGPCEDAVSRSSLLNKLDDCYKEKIKVAPDNMAEGFMQVEKLIKQEPSVTHTRKKGKWIKSNIGGAKVCSVCQAHMGLSNFNYCPNCGAEMESE